MNTVDYKQIAETVWIETVGNPSFQGNVDDVLFVFDNDSMHCTTLYVAPEESDTNNKQTARDKTMNKLLRRKKDAPLAIATVSSLQIKPTEYCWYVQIYTGKSAEYCVARIIDKTSGSSKYGSYQFFPNGSFEFMDKIGSKVRYTAERLPNGEINAQVADKGITYADVLNMLNVGESCNFL